jgi:hypothetical protein
MDWFPSEPPRKCFTHAEGVTAAHELGAAAYCEISSLAGVGLQTLFDTALRVARCTPLVPHHTPPPLPREVRLGKAVHPAVLDRWYVTPTHNYAIHMGGMGTVRVFNHGFAVLGLPATGCGSCTVRLFVGNKFALSRMPLSSTRLLRLKR